MLRVHILASGSDGNCIVLESDEGSVMIDAGLSGRGISELMSKCELCHRDLKGILISHEHGDHIRGAGVLSRRFNVPVLANHATLEASPIGEVKSELFRSGEQFQCGPFSILPLPTFHDAIDPVCFSVEHDGRKILVATDTGRLSDEIEAELAVADLAVIESNYDPQMLRDGPYPAHLKKRIDSDFGHLSNVRCGQALERTDTGNGRQVFLAHLSRNNNNPDIARETVASITGIKRLFIDCLEFPGDYRSITV